MKQQIVFVVMIVMALVCINLVNAANYYVSKSGDDSNSGLSEAAPIKTLAKLSTLALNPGDRVGLKCGDTWTEKWNYQGAGNGATGNPITFDRYGNCQGDHSNDPIISGGQGIDQQGAIVFFGSRNNIDVNNIQFVNAVKNGVDIYQSSNIKFSHCIFKNNYNNAIIIDSSNGITIENSYFDTNGLKMNAEHNGGETIWVANAQQITIQSNTVLHSGGVAINLWHSNNIDVRENNVRDCTAPDGMYEVGIYFDGCADSTAQNNYVQGCHIGYSVNSEVSGYTSDRIVFDHNIGYNNQINQVVDTNLGAIVNNDITISSNTFVKDITPGAGGYNNDLIIKGVSNLIFKDNLISDYAGGNMLTFSNVGDTSFTNNLWYSSTGDYPKITQQNAQTTNPLLADKTSFKPSGTACGMSSTGSYIGAVSCSSAPPAPVCGDGTCSSNEDCNSCSADCGTCPLPPPSPVCGDGTCSSGETCSSCASDCGTCPLNDTITACALSNKNWNVNGNLANAYNLSKCFNDPLKSTLSFSATGQQSINVVISSTGMVSLSAPANWVGSERIRFTASSGSRSASTNRVTLTVNKVSFCGDGTCDSNESCSTCVSDCGACPVPAPQPTPQPSHSGGGGGGGGSLVIANKSDSSSGLKVIGRPHQDNLASPASAAQQTVVQNPAPATSNKPETQKPTTQLTGAAINTANNNAPKGHAWPILVVVSTLFVGLMAMSVYRRNSQQKPARARAQKASVFSKLHELQGLEPVQESMLETGKQEKGKDYYSLLNNYIVNNLSKGYAKEKIEFALLSVGWPKEIVTNLVSLRYKDLILNDPLYAEPLHEYVTEALRRGYSQERIASELSGAGWPSYIVTQLMPKEIA